MKNKTLFNDQIFNLPIIRKEPDVIKFINNLFETFLDKIKLFDDELGDKIRQNLGYIEMECSLIQESLELYYNGKISDAFLKIEECLNILKSNNLLETSSTIERDFYRIRTSTNKNLNKGDLFHIPFQIREKVGTQRYSIPGLPCLYMADSIFVAWEELDRPSFESVHVSRFNMSASQLNILYLNVTTDDMRKRCFKLDKIQFLNQLVKFISYWPLLAACSLRVIKRNEVFKPEYIIPQMVLQYVISNSNIDGIQFKSNRVLPSGHNIGSFNNIVIPVKTVNNRGYCEELISKIKLTSPLSWSLLDISDPNHLFIKKQNSDLNVDDVDRSYYVEVIEGERTDYSTSKFGIMENKLQNMPLDYISK